MISLSVSWTTPVPRVVYTIILMDATLDVRGLHSNHREKVSFADLKTVSFDKPVSDGLAISDDWFLEYSAIKADAFGITDQFSRVCVFVRLFSEEVGISDQAILGVEKPLYDGIVISDHITKGQEKNISDGVSFGDSQLTKSMSVLYRETVGFSDSFFLNGNDYCDGTYFAQEYVGVARFA